MQDIYFDNSMKINYSSILRYKIYSFIGLSKSLIQSVSDNIIFYRHKIWLHYMDQFVFTKDYLIIDK